MCVNRLNLLFWYIAGEWHQYDDIICVEPSKNMLKRLKDAFWPDQRKGVIQGREIAGAVMLETIFDLLRNWGKMNLYSFFSQLRQFYEVYGNPFVFENTEMKWYSLNYNEKDVSKPFGSQHILNTFIHDNISSPKNENRHFFCSHVIPKLYDCLPWSTNEAILQNMQNAVFHNGDWGFEASENTKMHKEVSVGP